MTYHLPRALHWLQNQSLAHYPTSILRQLFMPPFAEMGILHVLALSNGDHLAFVVQWLSMAGALLAVWVLTEQVTNRREAALTAVAFAATLPMGLLQASSTQNDWVLTVWLAIAAVFVLAYRRDNSTKSVIGAALAIGLALLTKGTAFIFGFPLSGPAGRNDDPQKVPAPELGCPDPVAHATGEQSLHAKPHALRKSYGTSFE